jgi:hypothetical protein
MKNGESCFRFWIRDVEGDLEDLGRELEVAA